VQGGVSQAGFLLPDSSGVISFTTTDVPTVLVDFGAGQLTVNATNAITANMTAAQDAANSAASAQSSADSAAASAGLVGAPAGAAVDARASSGWGAVVAASASYADVQAALTSAASSGKRAVAAGTITTSSTLTITSDCDLSQLTINYTGTGVAVRVGNGTVLRRKRFSLPVVIEANKPTTGWNTGTVGVKLDTLSDCKVTLNEVRNFETGVLCYGTSNEFSYNEVHVAGLNNNKRNMYLDADASGWVNQNLFLAGRYSHNSGEGTRVVGCSHVYLADVVTSRPNGNTWVGASFESPNVVEYALNVESGQYNQFSGCRWEDTSGSPRVRWGAKAIQNLLIGGYLTDAIVFTKVAGAGRNLVLTSDRQTIAGSGNPMWQLENNGSSANPILALYNAGTIDAAAGYSPTADWVVALAATFVKMKNKADTQPRVQIDQAGVGAGGGVQFGSGSAAPDVLLGRAAAGVLGMGTASKPLTTGTTSPAAGAAGALPATPAGYLTVNINGTNRQIPYY
jgi:hypothetical protein